MFAVIKTGGKQYRVAAEDVITVEKVKGEPGDVVEFGEVLLLGGDNIQLGSPTISGASVAGEVVEQGREGKVIAFKKRRRQNSRRKRGHRQEFTIIRITEILTEGKKPTPRPKAEPKPVEAAPAEAGEQPAETPTATRAKPKSGARPPKKAAAKAKKAPKAKAKAKAAKKPVKPAKGKAASKGKKK